MDNYRKYRKRPCQNNFSYKLSSHVCKFHLNLKVNPLALITRPEFNKNGLKISFLYPIFHISFPLYFEIFFQLLK